MKMMHSIMFKVEIPPSANSIWRSYRGRVVKSKKYTLWQQISCLQIGRVGTFLEPVAVSIEVVTGKGWRSNRDLDNIAKPILDLLKTVEIIQDDSTKFVKSISLRCIEPQTKSTLATCKVQVVIF